METYLYKPILNDWNCSLNSPQRVSEDWTGQSAQKRMRLETIDEDSSPSVNDSNPSMQMHRGSSLGPSRSHRQAMSISRLQTPAAVLQQQQQQQQANIRQQLQKEQDSRMHSISAVSLQLEREHEGICFFKIMSCVVRVMSKTQKCFVLILIVIFPPSHSHSYGSYPHSSFQVVS
jgi:hypothetical protein